MEDSERNSPLYRLSAGKSEIYGVAGNQLQALRQTIQRIIESEKLLFNISVEEEEEHPVHIHKSTMLFADNERAFVSYSLHTSEGDLPSMSSQQLKCVALAALDFLRQYGDDGSTPAERNINAAEAMIGFEIEQDNRRAQFQTVPYVTKSVNQVIGENAEVCYQVGINEMVLQELSLNDLVALSQQIETKTYSINKGKMSPSRQAIDTFPQC